MSYIISNKLIRLMLLLMKFYHYVRCQDQACLTHASCMKSGEPYDFVAPCVRHADGQKAFCDTEALGSYYNYQVCTPSNCQVEEKNHCENNPCNNNGECLQMFGSYSCLCSSGYHGRNCTDPLEPGTRTVRGIYFLFSKNSNIRLKNLLYIFISDPGDGMKILFSAGDSGEVIETNEGRMQTVNGKMKCKAQKLKEDQCRHIPNEDMLYQSLHYELVYNTEGSVIVEYYPKENIPLPGFKINHLSVKIYNKESEEFNQVFNQVVSYRKEICPVQVVITQNCGSSSDKPLKISRKANKVIKSFLKKSPHTEEECPNQIVDYRWRIFEFRKKLWTPWSLPIKSANGSSEYNVKQFLWPFGLYKVKLTVAVSGIKRMASFTENYSNDYDGICFFEIVKVSLEINIEGGFFRTVSKFEQFVLDASQSYDPNEPRDHQSHLRWTWVCNGTVDICKPRTLNHGIYEFPNGLPEGVLEFTLTLQTTDASNNPVTSSQIVIISDFPQVQIDISCLKNCGIADFKTNPKEVVYLKANVVNNFHIEHFLWTFSVDGDPQENNVDEIAQPSIKSNVLIIKENALKFGSEYVFKVRPADTFIRGTSTIRIIVNNPPKGGSCNISPEVGYSVTTEFSIVCSNFDVDNSISQLNYEFYQKAPEQNHPGTMLGYSTSGQLKNVILTQKDIIVRISEVHGMYTDVSLQVTLDDSQQKDQNIEQLLRSLTSFGSAGDSGSKVRIVSAIIDVIDPSRDKLVIVNQVLESLRKERLRDFSDVKMFTSVLGKIVSSGVPKLKNGIDSSAVKSMGGIMASLSEATLNTITGIDKKEAIIIVDDIKNIASTMLECTDVILNSKDKVIFDPSSSNRAMFASHDHYKTGTSDMIAALHWTGLAILNSLLPHEQETVLEAKDSAMWLRVEHPEVLANISSIPKNSSTNIKITKSLGKMLHANSDNVAIKVTTFKKNPFWWDLEDKNIASEIVSVRVWDNSRRNKLVTEISEPLDIYFNLKHTKSETISGNVTMPYHSDSEDQKDFSVAVHILEAPPENSNGKLFVEFINLQNTELRVLLSVNLRPDYSLMMSNAQLVSSNFTTLSLSYENISADTLHFIGILPGVKTGAKQVIPYSFNTYSIQCKLRHKTVWTSPACKIGKESSNTKVHCRCSHMSFFGSSIFVAPNSVHPIKDLYLLMTVKDNPLVFSIVVSLLIVYLLLLIWSKVKEKRDRLKRKVIVLEDNFPGESYPYLVVVFTAFNIGAGTCSNVGIRLIGSNGPSRAHILRSKIRKVLKRNADDWFLLFTHEHLGDLETIHIWHDNTGSNPDWYCRKIHVYDLTTEKEYTFMVEQWLSVRPGEYPEAVMKALGLNEYDWKKVFIHNLIYHLQENHLWASIFICHPRATLTKCQRLTITFCMIFVSFLTGIMFYGVARSHITDISEDEPEYSIRYREIVVAIQSVVMSALVTSVVMICFRKSNTVLQDKEENSSSSIPVSEYKNGITKKRQYVLLKIFTKTLYMMVKGKPLMPVLVGMESYESVVRRRKWGTAGWLISQLTIWISAFFIILYGLKLGKVISKLWVTSALLSFGQEMFVSAPLKILAFSTILAMFGEMYKVETYECDKVAAEQREMFGDKHFLSNLLTMRTSCVYQPLPPEKVNTLRNLYMRRNNITNHIEFVITVLFIVILMNFAGYLWVNSRYYINSHISLSLSRSLRSHEVALEDANDIKKLTSYLVITLIPSIYKGRWYNRRTNLTSPEESRLETGWFMDATHRMIGIPRLRQIRVKQEYCPQFLFNVDVTLKTYCFPSLKKNTIDTDCYGLKWSRVSEYINKPLLEPWSYHREPDGSSMYGTSNIAYPSGGYIVMLMDRQRASASTISDLRDLNWCDIRLRVLFSELNLFNPNTNTYTAVTIISEHLPGGAMNNRIHVLTFNLDISFLYSFIFMFILVLFNFQLIYVVNRQGVFELVSNFWSCLDLILVILSNTCAAIHWLKIFQTNKAIHLFQQVGDSGFFFFSNIVFYHRISLFLWVLLLTFASIRILRFNVVIIMCKVTYYTLLKCKKLLIFESIVIIVLILIQMCIIDFAISPVSKPSDIGSRFHVKRNSSLYLNSYSLMMPSLMLALTCWLAILFFQMTLIKSYKNTKSMFTTK